MKWNREGEGWYESSDKRFDIQPRYLGCTRAQYYDVRDKKAGKSSDFDTVRDCKAWAERMLVKFP